MNAARPLVKFKATSIIRIWSPLPQPDCISSENKQQFKKKKRHKEKLITVCIIIIIIIIISPIWLKTLHSSLTSWFSDQEEKGKNILTFWFQELYCCRSLCFWGISSDSSRTGILDTLHSTHFRFIWNVSHCAPTSFTCCKVVILIIII